MQDIQKLTFVLMKSLNLNVKDGMRIYLNTIMSEALEKWPIELFSRLLPRVYQIIEEINLSLIHI